MKQAYFLLVTSLLLISCKKANNNDIDLSILYSHNFIDTSVNEYHDNIYTENNDTVKLSFEDKDILKLYHFYYGNGTILTKVDTGFMKYGVINGNEIAFGWLVDKPQGINYAFSLHWFIQVLNSDTLMINSYSNDGSLTGQFGYKPMVK